MMVGNAILRPFKKGINIRVVVATDVQNDAGNGKFNVYLLWKTTTVLLIRLVLYLAPTHQQNIRASQLVIAPSYLTFDGNPIVCAVGRKIYFDVSIYENYEEYLQLAVVPGHDYDYDDERPESW